MNIEFNKLKKVLDEYCTDVKKLYEKKSRNKFSTHELLNNFIVKATFNDNVFSVKLNTVDYFQYVEEGRRPGKFPPLFQIEEWINRKGILPKPDSNGKLPTQKSLAYMIGRKIANEGYKPTHYLAETMNELNKVYEKKFQEAFDADVAEFLKKTTNEVLTKINKKIF